ncbi:FAD:protein FMN transferase [Paraglaciecola aestuariivivens]
MQLSFKLSLFSLVMLLTLLACNQPESPEIHLTGPTMGTHFNVKVVNDVKVDKDQLQSEIEQELAEINQLMSTYISDSELSQFNQWNSTEPFTLSDKTLVVLHEAKRLGELSQGVLDVTVGPLVNLWGFGPQSRPEKIPSPQLIQQTKQKTGLDKLQLAEHAAYKTQPDLYVDLSTIAKGYAVDQLADILLAHNIKNFLVEIGGEMRLAGKKASGMDWKIAIEKPQASGRAVQKIISIGNNAVATSGDYRNYYEFDGERYSHLIDPVSGYPISHNLVSVTVIHPSSMTADGLATALNVMGKERALALSEQHNLAVMLITKETQGFTEYTSSKFQQLVTVH